MNISNRVWNYASTVSIISIKRAFLVLTSSRSSRSCNNNNYRYLLSTHYTVYYW